MLYLVHISGTEGVIMKFYKPNDDNKIHINLSSYAMSIIDDDMFTFGVNNKSTFINIVFENYKEDATSSISIKTEEYKTKLNLLLCNFSNNTKESIIDTLSKEYKMKLQKSITSEKGVGIKIRLNNNNTKYLIDDFFEEGTNYSQSIGKYLKAIIEEYCRKPYITREKIFFKDKYELIKSAIEDKKRILLWHKSYDTKHIILPFSITQDNNNLYNYIVGFEITDQDIKSKKIFVMRLSNIQEIRITPVRASISKNDVLKIQNALQDKGVQFLSQDMNTYKIRFSDSGLNKYNSIHHLRPNYTHVDSDGIYTFICTSSQFEFYFFKFGADAEVIEPAEMREKFVTMYQAAANLYKN